jgi:glycosyltransferase involved in cell wall biosynthesis
MAAALAQQAATWVRARLVVVDTTYAEDRESLARFSFRKLGRMLRYLVAATSAARRERADLVVVTPSFYAGPFLKDAAMIVTLKTLTRAGIVAWVNMDPSRLVLARKPWWYRRIATLALGRVDSWVASATTLLDQWPSFIPRGRCFAIAYGIPEAPVRADGSAEPDGLRVCYLSSLEEAKGWTDLLEAAEEVCSSQPSVVFDFYGDVGVGSTREEIVERFAATAHPDRIRWHGVVRGDAKWASLAASDIFCLPSHTEQLPLVLLEAMSVGLPIVATRVGAVEEAVVEGSGGWLVEPRRPQELTRLLLEALSDRERLRRYGGFNALRQRREYSLERFGADWEQLLHILAGVSSLRRWRQ